MRVIGYLRVSTEDQATNGHGLEAQRTAITAEALRKGSDVEWVEDAGRSGRSMDRPGLAYALDRLKTGAAPGGS